MQDDPGGLLQHGGEVVRVLLVGGGAALVVAQADDQHFAQAALEGTHKVGVQLHPVDGDDQVGLEGRPVKPDGPPVGRVAQQHRVHRGDHGDAQVLLGDAIAGEHLTLALLGAAAVAAHGGDDKGLGPQGLQALDRGVDHGEQVPDAPAAHGHGDAGSRLHQTGHLGPGQLFLHRTHHIGELLAVELLPHPIHGGQGTFQVLLQQDRHFQLLLQIDVSICSYASSIHAVYRVLSKRTAPFQKRWMLCVFLGCFPCIQQRLKKLK